MDEMASYRDLMMTRGIAPLLLVAGMSRLAGRMFTLTAILFSLQRFHSAEIAGWVSFAAFAPGLVVSPIAGVFLDRIGPVRAISIDMVAGSVLLSTLAILDALGSSNVIEVLVLMTLFALTSPLSAAGVRTLFPALVPGGLRSRVNAIDTAIYGFVDIAGPALAGMLLWLAGPQFALGFIAAAYLASALLVKRLDHPVARRPVKKSLLDESLQGVLGVLRQPVLRGLAVSYSLYQISWGVLVVVVPVLAVRYFSADTADIATGLIWTAGGTAGALGAIVAGYAQGARLERLIMISGMALTSVASWPVADSGLVGLILGVMLIGLVAGPIDVAHLTMRQRHLNPLNAGRDLSVQMHLNMIGLPIGSAVAGVLVSVSPSGAFMVAAAASAIATVAAALLLRSAS